MKRALLFLAFAGCASGPTWEPCENKICARCLGSGTYECDACDSMAYVDCTWCRRGLEPCVWCYGIGYEYGGYRCISCRGKGRMECRRCRGTLKAPCYKCRGTGRARCGRWVEPNPARSAPAPAPAPPPGKTPDKGRVELPPEPGDPQGACGNGGRIRPLEENMGP